MIVFCADEQDEPSFTLPNSGIVTYGINKCPTSPCVGANKHRHSRSPLLSCFHPRLSSKILERLVASKRAIKLKDSQISQIQDAKCCEKSPDLLDAMPAMLVMPMPTNGKWEDNSRKLIAESCSKVDYSGVEANVLPFSIFQLHLWMHNSEQTHCGSSLQEW